MCDQPSIGSLAPAELCPGCWVGGCVNTWLWVAEAMGVQSGISVALGVDEQRKGYVALGKVL